MNPISTSRSGTLTALNGLRAALPMLAGLALAAPVSAAADSSGTTSDPRWTRAQRYAFEYRVDFSALALAPSDPLRVWVPYPAENRDQELLSATIESPWPYTLEHDDDGNRMLHLEGRGRPATELVLRFLVLRRPSRGVPVAAIEKNTPLDPERYLDARRLIPLGGVIRRLAEEQAAGIPTQRGRTRAFYDYVVTHLRYDKRGEGWGRGDAIWACDHKRGNCTDFHSLFIGMARSQRIPARFVIGFPMPSDRNEGVIAGYHCWAQFFDADRGWLPVDASEASKAGQPDAYYGRLPNDRIEFSLGRDLRLAPPQSGPPLNYFIYPYAEIDGRPVRADTVRTHFRFQRLRKLATR